MKHTKLFFVLSIVILTLVSCNKKKEKDDTIVADPVVTKDVLSSDWTIGNGAWEFDFGNGNLTTNPFTSYVRFSNGDTCTCTDTKITGNQSGGAYALQSCAVTANPSGNLDCSIFETAAGAYTNSNGILGLQRNPPHGGILSYH